MRWWEGLEAVEVEGPRGAPAQHRLRWERGELTLTAHPDPDADRAMHALGGERCPCLALLDAWQATHADGGFLVVGQRDPGASLPVPDDAIALLQADLARWQGAIREARAAAGSDAAAVERLATAAAPAEAEARRRLGALLLVALDRRLQVRLQASIAAGLDPASPALEVATAGRALAPLRALGWQGDLSAIRVGGASGMDADAATLPPAWIPRVWAAGLAGAVAGHLVLDVTSVTPGGGATVVAAAPGKAEVVIRVDGWENA